MITNDPSEVLGELESLEAAGRACREFRFRSWLRIKGRVPGQGQIAGKASLRTDGQSEENWRGQKERLWRSAWGRREC